ncbi:MAG: HDIG domain-containing protein [Planctomycetota bacterium]
MNRAEALELLYSHVKEKANRQHALESEAVMRAMAERLGQNADDWGLCGLLHDLDWEACASEPEKHGLMTVEILKNTDLSPEIIEAIPHHNHSCNGSGKPVSLMAKALMPCETVTGLIIACVLVRPDKDIAAIPVSSIRKKFKDKAFARNCSRTAIAMCEDLGVPLEEFLAMSRDAIAAISHELEI